MLDKAFIRLDNPSMMHQRTWSLQSGLDVRTRHPLGEALVPKFRFDQDRYIVGKHRLLP